MTHTVARVLGYLTLRVVVNSIRRAFANPLRAILTTFVLAFFLCGWGAAIIGSLMENPAARAQPDMLQPQQLDAPLHRAGRSSSTGSMWCSRCCRPCFALRMRWCRRAMCITCSPPR
jgi:predicted PurR-regulated permease PerM